MQFFTDRATREAQILPGNIAWESHGQRSRWARIHGVTKSQHSLATKQQQRPNQTKQTKQKNKGRDIPQKKIGELLGIGSGYWALKTTNVYQREHRTE